MKPSARPSVVFALSMWAMLLLRFGYRYGTGDQVELLPYVLFLQDHTLFPSDFFIQGLHAAVPNERTVMAHLLLPFVTVLEWAVFLLHITFTVVLISGLEAVGLRLVHNRAAVWLGIFLALIPLNDYGLGNVELYSECLQASLVATAFIPWAILFAWDRKFLLSSLLFASATMIQLLDGLDVFLVTGIVVFWGALMRETNRWVLLKFLVPFLLSAGVYLLVVYNAKTAGENTISEQDLFAILFKFRHPHHFIFASFSKIKILVYVALTLMALWYFKRRHSFAFRFIAIGTAILIGYIAITDLGQWVFVANFQFYKITQWIKWLGALSVSALLFQALPGSLNNLAQRLKRPVALSAIVFSLALLFFFRNNLPYRVPYQLFGWKEADPMIDICQKIQLQTPRSAVFIQPYDNTELKFYGRRSSFVEFKANVRHKTFVMEWYNRIRFVYGVSTKDINSGFALRNIANNHFEKLSETALRQLKAKGVTHMLTSIDKIPATGRKIIANEQYAVYQL